MANNENDFMQFVQGALTEIASQGGKLARLLDARGAMAGAATTILRPLAAKPGYGLVGGAAHKSLDVISAATEKAHPAAPTPPSGLRRFTLVPGPNFS
jgi:hypothetical protein